MLNARSSLRFYSEGSKQRRGGIRSNLGGLEKGLNIRKKIVEGERVDDSGGRSMKKKKTH